MRIPECYGRGIYEYWKLKKDSVRFLMEAQKKGDPLGTLIGLLLTGGWSVADVLHALGGRIDRTLLPKDECLNCPYLKGCFGAAVSMIMNEIEEELKEDENKKV